MGSQPKDFVSSVVSDGMENRQFSNLANQDGRWY